MLKRQMFRLDVSNAEMSFVSVLETTCQYSGTGRYHILVQALVPIPTPSGMDWLSSPRIEIHSQQLRGSAD